MTARAWRVGAWLALAGLVGIAIFMGGCAASVSWGSAEDLSDAGERLVDAAPLVGRGAGATLGGAVGGPAGAAVGGDLGEWATKAVLAALGLGGVVDSAKQRKRRGQAEADKREALVAKREADLAHALALAKAGAAA